uniref:Uncharacterized protein n=1 Tax=Arundo donax TaxID=35708 RepID=A0A0A8YMD8_ARUDO
MYNLNERNKQRIEREGTKGNQKKVFTTQIHDDEKEKGRIITGSHQHGAQTHYSSASEVLGDAREVRLPR